MEEKENGKYILLRPTYPDKNVFEFEDISKESEFYSVPVDRPLRIYCDGVYDLFHYGHARSLQQAKHLFPNVYLLVGVTGDDITCRLKGNVVLNERERAESLVHCKYVDEVIADCPWEITPEFMEKYKIDLVAHDELPYKSGDKDDIYRTIKEMGKFVPIKRTKGVSTSGIITKIVRDYDTYVRRNLERGVSAKDLNVSFLQVKKIKMSKKMNELMRNVDIQKEIDDIRKEISVAMRYWEKMSNDFINSFIQSFHRKSDSSSLIDRIVGLVRLKRKANEDGETEEIK
jgi:cytidyltransferase-like protein